jgi:hypothetical protein
MIGRDMYIRQGRFFFGPVGSGVVNIEKYPSIFGICYMVNFFGYKIKVLYSFWIKEHFY